MKLREISTMVVLLGLLQLLRWGIKQTIFLFVDRTNFTDHLASMTAMSTLTVLILLISKKRKVKLSVFPEKFTKSYLIGTIIFALILVSTPANYTGDIQVIILLGYSSLVTPIFEELIFRGYVWNRLSVIFNRESTVYLGSSFSFGIWHLGYLDSLTFRVETDLVKALLWKVITGLCYGLVLGLLRLKTRNCYSTMLLHGTMNVFGR
ncbi:lysostaphin resistance A-like protein [Enterococcus sp. DIV0756]|uniref:CPBP family intramembrane glutamic endopeptidase n=1 Tax=Enterococcus sp. DIV0756 TaxID=2774636 RepID=UPI003F1F4898